MPPPAAWPPPNVLLSKGFTACAVDKPSVWFSNALTKLEERLAYSSTTLLMLPLSSRISITFRVRLSGILDSWFWLISLMSRRLWSSKNCTWEKLCSNDAHTLPCWRVGLFAGLLASMLPSPAPNAKTYSFPKKGSLSPLLLLLLLPWKQVKTNQKKKQNVLQLKPRFCEGQKKPVMHETARNLPLNPKMRKKSKSQLMSIRQTKTRKLKP